MEECSSNIVVIPFVLMLLSIIGMWVFGHQLEEELEKDEKNSSAEIKKLYMSCFICCFLLAVMFAATGVWQLS